MPQEAGGYQSFGFLFRNPQKTWWKGGIFDPPKQVFFDRISSKFLYVHLYEGWNFYCVNFWKYWSRTF